MDFKIIINKKKCNKKQTITLVLIITLMFNKKKLLKMILDLTITIPNLLKLNHKIILDLKIMFNQPKISRKITLALMIILIIKELRKMTLDFMILDKNRISLAHRINYRNRKKIQKMHLQTLEISVKMNLIKINKIIQNNKKRHLIILVGDF